MLEKKELLEMAKSYFDNEKNVFFKDELQKVIDSENWEELNDRFYTSLEFGTGGLRGVIGGGLNRMNPYNISKAAQGMADYINENVKGEKSAAIAYDSRLYSDLFGKSVALVLAANGIKSYLFSSLRPTPELSFAIRKLGCTTGAVVTASHNPQEYNGFKVYWDNGGQVIAPHDKGIIDKVNEVKTIKQIDEKEAIQSGLLQIIDKEIDDSFIEMTKKYSLRPETVRKQAKETKIVYTPLNGTGKMLVERILDEMGITVITVPEQAEPDGTFPTCPFPNPEIAETMQLALDLGAKESANLVMGTDPDADRLGIAVPSPTGWQLISGNQLGAMLSFYILSTRKELGILPPNPAVIKTIVTTKLTKRIAESFGATCEDVLTGFKWIADKMDEYERTGKNFILGYEESYGFLTSKEVRDKDAIGAAAMVAEMALYCASQGSSVLDYLNKIYKEYGFFEEIQVSKTFKGEQGILAMENLMDSIRKDPPKEIAGQQVAIFRDYNSFLELDLVKNVKNTLTLPKSNVLQFELVDGSVFTIRPSGTEPKIKFYVSCCSDPGLDLTEAKAVVKNKIDQFQNYISEVIN